MKAAYLFFVLIAALIISPACAAITYDIVCNVDGARCFVDGEYVGDISGNHFYYTTAYSSEPKSLEVKTDHEAAETQLPVWLDDWTDKRIVINLPDDEHPPIGTLNIYTLPDGATIYFQDDYPEKGSYKEIGTTHEGTPYKLTTYQGFHRIKIWLDGYEPITDRIYVYGDNEFDTLYYLEYVGDHTPQPDLTAVPTPTPEPTPTP
ncbi:MAG: PEGA domain-containing protein, partial [Novosphingobium sp.]|nr:PEGA domain-containing protein [Novosphingobium sp.]